MEFRDVRMKTIDETSPKSINNAKLSSPGLISNSSEVKLYEAKIDDRKYNNNYNYNISNNINKGFHDELYKNMVIKLFKRASQTKSVLQSRNEAKLTAFKRFIKYIGTPYNKYKIIHVGGTNGKGSVCKKLSNYLNNIGYNVGLITSPHITCVRERITINGILINEYDFGFFLNILFKKEEQYNIKLTYFELITALGFYYFDKKNIDFALIEVGMGGTYDTTNVIERPILCIIVSIGYDHCEYLGNTLDKITKEKAGIIKYNIPVIIGKTVIVDVIKNKCNQVKSTYYQLKCDNMDTMNYDEHNTELCKLAIKILSKQYILPVNIDDETEINNINKCLNIKPQCRFQEYKLKFYDIIKSYIKMYETLKLKTYQKYYANFMDKIVNMDSNKILNIIFDVGHNQDGFKAFFEMLSHKYKGYKYRLVFCMLKKKDIIKSIQILVKYVHYIYCIQNPFLIGGAYKPNEIKTIITDNTTFNNNNIIITGNGEVSYTFMNALHDSYISDDKEVVIVLGSFYIMSNVRRVIGINEPNDDDFILTHKQLTIY